MVQGRQGFQKMITQITIDGRVCTKEESSWYQDYFGGLKVL
jgi:hypothetical protein